MRDRPKLHDRAGWRDGGPGRRIEAGRRGGVRGGNRSGRPCRPAAARNPGTPIRTTRSARTAASRPRRTACGGWRARLRSRRWRIRCQTRWRLLTGAGTCWRSGAGSWRNGRPFATRRMTREGSVPVVHLRCGPDPAGLTIPADRFYGGTSSLRSSWTAAEAPSVVDRIDAARVAAMDPVWPSELDALERGRRWVARAVEAGQALRAGGARRLDRRKS